MELIFDQNKQGLQKENLVEEITRTIRASYGNRAKESLILEFINGNDLNSFKDKPNIIAAFYEYAQQQQKNEAEALIEAENLNVEAAKRYIEASLKRHYASENGTDLNAILPKMSPLNPQYRTKKDSVFKKIADFVEKFKGIGDKI